MNNILKQTFRKTRGLFKNRKPANDFRFPKLLEEIQSHAGKEHSLKEISFFVEKSLNEMELRFPGVYTADQWSDLYKMNLLAQKSQNDNKRFLEV